MDFVSIDIWSLIFTWVNLIILFFIVKKLLYKPVKEVMRKRHEEVDKMYEDAGGKITEAQNMLDEYKERLSSADKEADGIIKNAVENAQRKSDKMLDEARLNAAHQLKNAQEQIENEKLKAIKETKGQISSMAVGIAGKILEREINDSDYKDMAEKFIDEMGDEK